MKKILLIDDDPKWRKITTRSLSNASYIVTEAANEEEAKEKAHRDHFDLFIIDLNLHPRDRDNPDSGLRLLGELPLETPKIVWSVLETPEVIRSAFDQPVHSSRPRSYVFKESEGTKVLLDKIRVVLAEEEQYEDQRNRVGEEISRHQAEISRMTQENTGLRQEVKRLQDSIDQRRQLHKKRLKMIGAVFLAAAIVAGSILLFSPQLLGDKLSNNVMLTGISSSLVASLVSFIIAYSRK